MRIGILNLMQGLEAIGGWGSYGRAIGVTISMQVENVLQDGSTTYDRVKRCTNLNEGIYLAMDSH